MQSEDEDCVSKSTGNVLNDKAECVFRWLCNHVALCYQCKASRAWFLKSWCSSCCWCFLVEIGQYTVWFLDVFSPNLYSLLVSQRVRFVRHVSPCCGFVGQRLGMVKPSSSMRWLFHPKTWLAYEWEHHGQMVKYKNRKLLATYSDMFSVVWRSFGFFFFKLTICTNISWRLVDEGLCWRNPQAKHGTSTTPSDQQEECQTPKALVPPRAPVLVAADPCWNAGSCLLWSFRPRTIPLRQNTRIQNQTPNTKSVKIRKELKSIKKQKPITPA